MSFKLPTWLGGKKDDQVPTQPAATTPDSVAPAADTSVSPTDEFQTNLTADTTAAEGGTTPVEPVSLGSTPEPALESTPAVPSDPPVPTSPAADLMGQTTPEQVNQVSPEYQPTPTPAPEGAPSQDVPAQGGVVEPASSTPTGEQGQPNGPLGQ
ncbi:MAG TPA: hypothetical protein VFQ70_00960 [Candidatus Saccharimonadaceae bacterium]|nr:hypothetical protein [Candidatus Saccharimonadaceae bacterium]